MKYCGMDSFSITIGNTVQALMLVFIIMLCCCIIFYFALLCLMQTGSYIYEIVWQLVFSQTHYASQLYINIELTLLSSKS